MHSIRKLIVAAALAGIALAAQARDVINLSGAQARSELAQVEQALQSAPNDFDLLKSAGILLHQMSRAEPDKAQVERGERYLKQAAALRPDDAETRAWLGSITTMKAIFESDPGKQTFYVKLGSRAMDGAVQQAPDNLVVRLTRGHNSLELPPFLKRARFAVEDFGHVVQMCAQQPCPAPVVSEAKVSLQKAQQLASASR